MKIVKKIKGALIIPLFCPILCTIKSGYKKNLTGAICFNEQFEPASKQTGEDIEELEQ